MTASRGQDRAGARVWLFSALVLATAAKTLLALRTYGTNDVYRNELFMIWSRELGVGIYAAAWDFNHPGFIIHWLQLLGSLGDHTSLPFSFWFRFHAVPADIGIVLLVRRMLESRLDQPQRDIVLILLALAPVLLLVSGFHGNTDSLMVFFLLLSIYLTERGWSGRAGLAFGAAMCFKIVPIVALPVLVLNQRSPRETFRFLASAVVVALAGWSPFVFQDPVAIARQVFGYRSYHGHWGLSYVTSRFGPEWLDDLYRRFGSYYQLVAVMAASLWMTARAARPRVLDQAGASFFLFLAISPGFGVQYLVWLAPFAAGLGVAPAAAYLAASGAFLFLVYNYWSGGIPWYLADSNRVGDYQGHLDYFQLLTWLAVLMLLFVSLRRIRDSQWRLRFLERPVFTLALVIAIGLPFERRLVLDSRSLERTDGKAAVRAIRSATYADLAARLEAMGRTGPAEEARRRASDSP